MISSTPHTAQPAVKSIENNRLDHLDAARAFALLLGIVFHSCISFVPVFTGWAVQDVSTSPVVTFFMTISHCFRMELFFLLAGLFSHMTFHRQGVGEFIRSRLVRLGLPFVIGWFILRPLLVSGWIMGSASLRGPVDIRAGLLGGFQSLATLPGGLFTGSHLWFLYYLMWITLIAVVVQWLLRALGIRQVIALADAAVARIAGSPFGTVMLAIPTAIALWFMNGWSMDTPDKSLRPHLPVLIIYGGFFGLGWLLNRQREQIDRFARLSVGRGMEALLGAAVIMLLGGIERDPSHNYYVVAHVAYVFGYALTMWSLVFLTLGLFKKLCDRPLTLVRYVADSSYWMYLVHLPVVVWLQVAFAELPMHWSLKLTCISAITIALALLSYDILVRSTFIGALLNGRRREPMLTFRSFRNVAEAGHERQATKPG